MAFTGVAYRHFHYEKVRKSGAQNNLYKLLHLESKPDYKKTSEITAQWHPYAGLVYFHLLLQKLNEKGAI